MIMTNTYKYNDINAIKAELRLVPQLQLLERKVQQIKAKRTNPCHQGRTQSLCPSQTETSKLTWLRNGLPSAADLELVLEIELHER